MAAHGSPWQVCVIPRSSIGCGHINWRLRPWQIPSFSMVNSEVEKNVAFLRMGQIHLVWDIKNRSKLDFGKSCWAFVCLMVVSWCFWGKKSPFLVYPFSCAHPPFRGALTRKLIDFGFSKFFCMKILGVKKCPVGRRIVCQWEAQSPPLLVQMSSQSERVFVCSTEVVMKNGGSGDTRICKQNGIFPVDSPPTRLNGVELWRGNMWAFKDGANSSYPRVWRKTSCHTRAWRYSFQNRTTFLAIRRFIVLRVPSDPIILTQHIRHVDVQFHKVAIKFWCSAKVLLIFLGITLKWAFLMATRSAWVMGTVRRVSRVATDQEKDERGPRHNCLRCTRGTVACWHGTNGNQKKHQSVGVFSWDFMGGTGIEYDIFWDI